MKKTLLLLSLIISGLLVSAQKQANNWYFGENAGISFSMGPPTPLTNGALNTWEGCSSISTATGQLEFYTDGRFVYDKNHDQMPHGSGLWGNESSTQSGIIVPKPGSSTEYYIFTVDHADNLLANGLCYSKVDMTLNGGLGDVVETEKNIQLVPLACEKVTAVGHADGSTFWVITKKWGNSDFYAYRITWDGVVVATPVISSTGPAINGNIRQASKGYLKVSPDGTKIAAANNTDFSVGIYNFDNSTGQVSHIVSDNSYTSPGGMDPGGPYGVEFSPNSKVLYIGAWKECRELYQYDLSSGDGPTILSSKQLIVSFGQGAAPVGALQLGPDNRMYIARDGVSHLSRINQPNVLGTGCDFVDNAVSLGGRDSRYGLPPFIQSFFYLSADFYWDEPACTGYPTNFNTSASETPDSVKWTFPGNVTSTILNPSYHFQAPGLYPVKQVVYIYGLGKTVSHFVRVGTTPEFEIGNDSTICASEAFFLDAGNYTTYQWQNGDTTQNTFVDTTGWYSCTITNSSGCPATDSLYMIVNQNPIVDAGPDPTIPEGTTTVLTSSVAGGSGNYSYHWEPAAMLVNPNILQPTTVPMVLTTQFTLTITDTETGCTGQDQVLVNVTGGPLGCIASADPPAICVGEQTNLHCLAYGGEGIYTIQWTSNPPGFSSPLQDPVVDPVITTTYNVAVNDGINTVYGSITITVNQLPLPNAGQDQIIVYGTPTTLEGNVTQGIGPYQYQWQPADKLINANIQNPTTVYLYESTVFSFTVTDLGTGCSSSEPDLVSVNLSGDALSANPSAEPGTICYGSEVQLFALAGGGTTNYTYNWTSNPSGFTSPIANPIVSPTVTTTYTVRVSDGYNSANGNVTVTVNPAPVIDLIPRNNPKVQILSPNEIGVCVFDSVKLNAGNPGADYLWSNGSIEQAITTLTSGISFDQQEFSVSVTDPISRCTNNANIIIYFTFSNCSYGIEENGDDNGFLLYPNPSDNGVFNINFGKLGGKVTLEIYNSQGSSLQSETYSILNGGASNTTFELKQRTPGIYFVRVTNNEMVYLHKLIINK